MTNRLSVCINKSSRGWSVDTEVYWEGMTHAARTGRGAATLAWALYQALELAADEKAMVEHICVNGQAMAKGEAMRILNAKFGGGILAYTLPRYAQALAVF